MGATKNLFQLMAQQDIQTSNFLPTKKEIEATSKKFVKDLIEAGEIDKYEAFTQAVRLSNAIDVVKNEIKNCLPKEKHSAFGIEITPVSGRTIINFEEDELWQELEKKIVQREALLKAALKSDEPIYDSDGVEVPKVSIKYAADSLQVKY